MHARQEEIEPAVAIRVENLDSHSTPGPLGEIALRCFAEARSTLVDPEMIGALHVEDVEIRESVVIGVQHGRIAAPARVVEANVTSNFLKPIAAEVVVQETRFGAVRMQVTEKGVVPADEVAARPARLGRETAHIRDEEIEPPVTVVIEE